MTKKILSRICALVIAVMMLVSLSVTAFAAGTGTYSDVSADDDCAKAVEFLSEQGYMIGTGGSKFSPELNTTRGMAVTVLYRLAGEPKVTGTVSFTDFKAGEYYSDAIIWASQNGIVNGYEDNTFRPDNNINFDEANAIISRYAKNIAGKDVAGSIADPNASSSTGMMGGMGGGPAGGMGGGIGGGAAGGMGGGPAGGMGGGMMGGPTSSAPAEPKPTTVTRSDFAVAVYNLITCISEHSLDLADYAGDWSYIPGGTFEVMGSNRGTPVPTGVYIENGVYALENVPYVTNPTISGGEIVQVLNIYVPEAYVTENEDGTISVNPDGKMTVTYYEEDGVTPTGTYTWTAETAPIFFANTVDGYAGSDNFDLSKAKAGQFMGVFPDQGIILVSAQTRGITDPEDDAGNVVGKAPEGLVDLKAVISFLKYNDDVLAGDSDKIFVTGASAGGAMASLLASSGDAPEFNEYLTELGAAKASNSIYGAMVCCPITVLDYADGAYEWFHYYQTSFSGWTGESVFDEYDLAVKSALIGVYTDYLQSLGFDISDDGLSGDYYDGLTEKIVEALNHAALVGGQDDQTPIDPQTIIDSVVSDKAIEILNAQGKEIGDVFYWDSENNTFVLSDFWIFDLSSGFGRMKGVPSFDGATESSLFGTAEENSRHFSISYLTALENVMNDESLSDDVRAQAKATYNEVSAQIKEVVDSGITNLMNPMYYLTGGTTSTVAKYWRLTNGTSDSDGGSVAAYLLANELTKLGYDADFEFIYGAPHGTADYRTQYNGTAVYHDNLLYSWIAECASK